MRSKGVVIHLMHIRSDAHKIIEQIAKLYKHEEKLAHLSGDAKLEKREQLIRPWLIEFKQHIDELVPQYLDKGLMRTALYYAQNNWKSMSAFMEHSELPLDNNPVENAIRPFTPERDARTNGRPGCIGKYQRQITSAGFKRIQ